MAVKLDDTYQQAKKQFDIRGGFARSDDLKKVGFSSSAIARLVEQGSLIRVKRGLYRWHKIDASTSLVEASRIVPGGVVCLLSALSVHELSTKTPREVHLAIPRKARRPLLPDYPPIRLAYFSDAQYQLGIMTVMFDNVNLSVYDPEKTLCDCARYRNKIGQDIFREALAEYLKRPVRNIDKLLDYAKKLRVWSVVHPMAAALA